MQQALFNGLCSATYAYCPMTHAIWPLPSVCALQLPYALQMLHFAPSSVGACQLSVLHWVVHGPLLKLPLFISDTLQYGLCPLPEHHRRLAGCSSGITQSWLEAQAAPSSSVKVTGRRSRDPGTPFTPHSQPKVGHQHCLLAFVTQDRFEANSCMLLVFLFRVRATAVQDKGLS